MQSQWWGLSLGPALYPISVRTHESSSGLLKASQKKSFLAGPTAALKVIQAQCWGIYLIPAVITCMKVT